MNFESLESRQMLSVSVNLDSSGLLTVIGTKKDEAIHLGSKKTYVQFLDNYGEAHNIDFGKVKRVVINMMGGNDTVVMNDSIHVPMTIIGGSGNDSLRGGGGDDLLVADAGDTLCGGDGFDVADFSGSSKGVVFNMADATIEAVQGSKFGDSITGTNGPDIIFGNAGNDTINGLNGDDYIDAGIGRDSLNGGGGSDIFLNFDNQPDTIDGGGGIDFVEQDDVDTFKRVDQIFDQSVIDNGGQTGGDTGGDTGGTDTGGSNTGGTNTPENITPEMASTIHAALALAVSSFASLDNGVLTITGDSSANSISVILDSTGKNISVSVDGESASFALADVDSISIDAGGGNDSIALQRGDGSRAIPVPAFILGSNGNDTIVGGANDDTISGGNGNDAISGMSGNDSLSGAMGDDTLDGGAGNDYLNGGTTDITGPDGADVISGGSGSSDTVIYTSRTDDLNIDINNSSRSNDGAAGEGDDVNNDIENIFSGTGNDTLTGNSAANVIAGNSGDDLIEGNGGHDKLIGGAGNDTLSNTGGDVTMFSMIDLAQDHFDGTLDTSGRATSDMISGDVGVDFSTASGRVLG